MQFDGREYTLQDLRPHRRRDGSNTLLIAWEGACQTCGMRYTSATSGDSKPSRYCERHRGTYTPPARPVRTLGPPRLPSKALIGALSDEEIKRFVIGAFTLAIAGPSDLRPACRSLLTEALALEKAKPSRPRRPIFREFPTPPEREYFDVPTADLKRFFREGRAEPYDLWCVLHELHFRSRSKPAQALRAEIEATIEALKESFRWPQVEPEGNAGGSFPVPEVPNVGMLRHLGYRVGKGADVPSRSARRAILKHAFEGALPFVQDRAYTASFGTPGSARRLEKLANCLAAFAMAAARKLDAGQDQAISDWIDDLQWMRVTYYTGRFDFSWPRVPL
jgi:hypothetical protein